ncbi:MAG TPA: hypothetical protein VKB80_31255 [Kofleriaceae bacterium]|nr:hypothetical protein [Kofleriaceae bacterium]
MARTRLARAPLLALALTSALVAAPARAGGDEDDGPPITSLEGRVGYGLAFGGGSGASSQRASGVTMTALVDQAVIEAPWTSIFGGIVAEGYGHGAAGVLVGARVRPSRGRLRIAGGAVGLLVPRTLFGPLASVGGCLPIDGAFGICLDLEAQLFVTGTDLPDERVAGQAQAVLGIAFDAL